jgi:hypothetical protein
MTPFKPLFAASFIAIATMGCVTMETTAKTRASNDMNCAEDQIAVRNIGGSSYRATGCNQEATYNCGQSTANTFVCQREEQKMLTPGAQPPAPLPATPAPAAPAN